MKLHLSFLQHERTGWWKVITNDNDMGSVHICNHNQHHVTPVNSLPPVCWLHVISSVTEPISSFSFKACVWGWKVKITRVDNRSTPTDLNFLIDKCVADMRVCCLCIGCIAYNIFKVILVWWLQVLIFNIVQICNGNIFHSIYSEHRKRKATLSENDLHYTSS